MATAMVNPAARRQNGKRLGLGLSAAGGLVLGAGLRAAGAGLVVGVAPLGVALAAGSLVVFADSCRLQRQRKQRSAALAATAEPAASVAEPEIAPLGAEEEQEQEEQSALQLSAAPDAAGSSTDGHDELVGAVLGAVLASPDKAAAPAAAASPFATTAPAAGPAVLSQDKEQEQRSGSVDLPAPIKSASPDLLPSGSTDMEDSAAASDCEPETDSPMAAACDDAMRAVGPDAGLPPLATKKKKTAAKKIKKGISKSFKKLGRALSINSNDAAQGTVEAAVSSPSAARPPLGAFLRRSFSNDARRASISSLADSAMASELAVDKSEGSQTIRKMKDLLRRSFSLSTPRASLDLSAKGSSMVMA